MQRCSPCSDYTTYQRTCGVNYHDVSHRLETPITFYGEKSRSQNSLERALAQRHTMVRRTDVYTVAPLAA